MAATRRRGDELVRAIHQAVLAEVAEHGYAGATYERVASRAGTSKHVLYRRWPTKGAMVLGALLGTGLEPFVQPDTGGLAGDLKALLGALRVTIESIGRTTMLSLLAEIEQSDGVALRELLFARGAEIVEPALDQARRRGELGDTPVPPRIAQVALDLVRHELVFMGVLTDEARDSIVDDIAVPLLIAHSRRASVEV